MAVLDQISLDQIVIYPIKSLDGIAVQQATVLESGALMGDREFAIVDCQGKFVNGKRHPAIHSLRSQFDVAHRTITVWQQGSPEAASFQLDCDRIPFEEWLSNFFGFPVKLIKNMEMGFPDDTDSPGATIISTETLQTLSTWFPDLDLDQLRRRFRSNFEISGGGAFWEDRLYREMGNFVPFQVGEVAFLGVNPCQRCIVPTRDPQTGVAYPDFQKIFVAKRQETLPHWVNAERFNHFYRLAVNTRVAHVEGAKTVHVGDRVMLASA